jgi:hypothetical protein
MALVRKFKLCAERLVFDMAFPGQEQDFSVKVQVQHTTLDLDPVGARFARLLARKMFDKLDRMDRASGEELETLAFQCDPPFRRRDMFAEEDGIIYHFESRAA